MSGGIAQPVAPDAITDAPNRTIAMIWAQARGGVIGQGGTMPWRVPEDSAHFKDTTMGGAVIMGRKTWDSLPARFRPLDGRRNIVITRQRDWSAQGTEVVHSLDDALALVTDGMCWIGGGGELYRQALPLATELQVTEFDVDVAGDTTAPPVDASWNLAASTPAAGWLDSTSGIPYRFLHYTR
ncbi:dihydrofolate reductase [Plantibacter sp. YIM 135249]|uniref:dihydrofolate reductase n=1 Tax=Plantibacter sp. YIM 135249 TaxID=3423918 RepID=UPI003D33B97D